MREDELQVLGTTPKDKKMTWLVIAAIAVIVLMIGAGFYIINTPKQPEKIRTGKKMGDPTIVPELQTAVDSLLNGKMTEIGNCLQGQVIVMDVQTGEILAMVGQERNYEKKFQPCKNFAYRQELGSLTKTASLLALLEMDVDTGYVVHTGEGIVPVDEERVMRDHNWRRGGYGDLNLSRALEVSSNIGIGQAVSKIFGKNQQKYFDLLEKMSFGQPEQIDGIEGLKPTLYSSPKDSDWVNWWIWWSAIGYERIMAPIQMLTFYNAIANNGKMVKPTLKTGEIEIINPQIASKENIATMQVVLEHVVSQGLGRKAGTRFIPVAGKTGTSQVAEYDFYNDEAGTPLSEYHLSFCGYFPAYKPKFSMIVSINKLGLPASGGGMAGDLFRQIVEWMITHDIPTVMLVDKEAGDTTKLKETDIH